jgi:septum formation protein
MPEQSHKSTIILASSSPYRKLLLERLGLPFEIFSPSIDESALAGETPQSLVKRLAMEKSLRAAQRFPSSVIIGSDQLAVCQGNIIGKPGNESKACEQLAAFSGQCVVFHTALAVYCQESGFRFEQTVDTEVCFRQLSRPEIERYVALDHPLDCAGSFKSEAAGVSLLDSMTSSDPTAIIGLPLITVSRALREAGLNVP